MLISLVSGTYNRLPLLQAMIESARATLPRGIDLEFIIVDGGSTDGTLAWCQTQADITLIAHGDLQGAIRAFCDGAKAARGKYVCLANDDITFYPNSLLLALVHLEERAHCGAVAFADNRPVPPTYTGDRLHPPLTAPAQRNGQMVYVPYAQVGLFRRWLGEEVGWWGADDPHFPARTYGGDNRLSSKIWERGYTVDAVDGCAIHDTVVDDTLRAHNRNQRPDLDSDAYYNLWRDALGRHTGPTIPPQPTLPQQDKRALRILYLPIFEQGNDEGARQQKRQKRGLRDALAKAGWVYELDYQGVAEGRLRETLLDLLKTFQPDILFTQLHSPYSIPVTVLRELRAQRPTMLALNWNGDTHRANLINPPMLELLREVDLQLVVNASVLPAYEQHGIPAAYWQIAFEPVDETSLPTVKAHDILVQGSAYNDQRKQLGRELRARFGARLGLYGDYWDDPDGRTLYDFARGRALYQQAKIALASNEFPNDYGFVSNRIFETLAAGGALLLQQHVPGLEEMTGITAGQHYIEWRTLDDLQDLLTEWLSDDCAAERQRIAAAARAYVQAHHSFERRVQQLFGDLLPLARKKLQQYIGLRYTGMSESQFGVRGLHQQYLCEPDQILFVVPDDAAYIIRTYGVFARVEETSKADELAEGVRALHGA